MSATERSLCVSFSVSLSLSLSYSLFRGLQWFSIYQQVGPCVIRCGGWQPSNTCLYWVKAKVKPMHLLASGQMSSLARHTWAPLLLRRDGRLWEFPLVYRAGGTSQGLGKSQKGSLRVTTARLNDTAFHDHQRPCWIVCTQYCISRGFISGGWQCIHSKIGQLHVYSWLENKETQDILAHTLKLAHTYTQIIGLWLRTSLF